MKKLMDTIFRTAHKGFSLVEFIVIISIFAIMAGVALFNFSGFNSSVSLNNLAHDIALTVRQSQVYGISGTEANTNFTQVRGVFFKHAAAGFDPGFIIFLDADTVVDTSDPYNSLVSYAPGIDVILDNVAITTADRIIDIETGFDSAGASSCASDVVIAFLRPDPDPLIFCGGTPGSFARITIENPGSGDLKYVEVWPTGQIAVVANPTTGGN